MDKVAEGALASAAERGFAKSLDKVGEGDGRGQRLTEDEWHGSEHAVARTEFPAKATHAQTRAHNASLVLRALYDLGPISRADIARLTGLTRTTSASSSRSSSRRAWPRTSAAAPSPAARQPTLVALVDDARHVVTLDLGERTFTAALAQPPRRDPSAAPPATSTARDGDAALAARPRPDRRAPRRAAQADPRHRRRHPGHRRRRRHDPLGRQPRLDRPAARHDASHERYGLPTVVANDSRAAAIATYLFEGEDRPENLVAIKVGRGIGAGLVLDGELFGGDGDGAGEIGHIVVEPDGAACHCGRFGCLETVASAPVDPARRRRGRPAPASSLQPAWPTPPRTATNARLHVTRGAGRALGGRDREPHRHRSTSAGSSSTGP